jgi:hypothetical protein
VGQALSTHCANVTTKRKHSAALGRLPTAAHPRAARTHGISVVSIPAASIRSGAHGLCRGRAEELGVICQGAIPDCGLAVHAELEEKDKKVASGIYPVPLATCTCILSKLSLKVNYFSRPGNNL